MDFLTKFFKTIKGMLLLLFFISFFIPSCSSNSKIIYNSQDFTSEDREWPTFLADFQRSGNVRAYLNLPLKFYWKARVSKRLKLNPFFAVQHSSPAVSDGIAYVGSTDNLFFAFDLKEKKLLWSFKTTGAVESSPTIYQGKVFFGTSDGKVYSLLASNGNLAWAFQTTSPVLSSPLVVEGKVIIKTTDGKLYALDSTTGKKIWQYIVHIRKKLHGRDYTSPAYFKKMIFVTFSNGSLVALRIEDGSEVFSKIVDKRNDGIFIPVQPVIDKGVIYTTDSNGSLLVFDQQGNEKWRLDFTKISSFIVTKNKVLIINNKGNIFALNKVTGETLWRRRITKGEAVASTATQDLLIVSSRYKTTYFDVELLSTAGGYIDIFDLKNGKKLWSYKTESGISSPPVVVDKKILFLTDKGFLHILRSF